MQYLSAKLGVVTGKSLPEHLGLRMRRTPRLLFWAQAEIVAAATDIAEVIGGALALHLLFGLPLVVGGIITGRRLDGDPADPAQPPGHAHCSRPWSRRCSRS